METITLQTKLPTRLLAQMESLVDEGWLENIDDLILDALRRFLETHPDGGLNPLTRWCDCERSASARSAAGSHLKGSSTEQASEVRVPPRVSSFGS